MTRIACLGWGSLIWDQKTLPVDGKWESDGPTVPVEFLRHSSNGRVTLVLDANGTRVPSLWAVLKSESIESAIDALRARENIPPDNVHRDVGRWTSGPAPHLIPRLPEWAAAHNLDAVVWTALSYASKRMKDRQSVDQVIEHFRSLSGTDLGEAKQYVRRAPRQVATAYRGRIEDDLGWTYIEG